MSSELITEDQPTEVARFSKQGWELVNRMAMAYSKSTLVPKAYQDNVGNCIIALNVAQRIGADPLMVMQNLYIVHGNPAWSAQFLIATFNSCGKYESIRYEWSGEPNTDTWGCTAVAIEKATGEVLKGTTVTMRTAKDEGWSTKSGSKWKTMPEQMLRYRAAAWMIRSYAPEIAMGLHTVEEMQDVHGYDTTPAKPSKVQASDLTKLLGVSEPEAKPQASSFQATATELFAE